MLYGYVEGDVKKEEDNDDDCDFDVKYSCGGD